MAHIEICDFYPLRWHTSLYTYVDSYTSLCVYRDKCHTSLCEINVTHLYVCIEINVTHFYVCIEIKVTHLYVCIEMSDIYQPQSPAMGWLRIVGALKL